MVDKKELCRCISHHWKRQEEIVDGREITQLICCRCGEPGPAHVNKVFMIRSSQELGESEEDMEETGFALITSGDDESYHPQVEELAHTCPLKDFPEGSCKGRDNGSSLDCD